MRALIGVAVLGSTAYAQSPYPDPPPLPPETYDQPVVIQLSPDAAALLARGEISDGEHVGGGFVSLVVGFGLGQAIQGRWADDGWKFTVGEGAALVGMIAGTQVGFDSGGDIPLLFMGSALVFLGLRLWDIYDAVAEPPRHNARVRMLRVQLGIKPSVTRVMPFIKTHDNTSTAGLVFRF